jgi:hypothetical protein
VAAGDSYVRTYTFVRTSGPGGTRTYNVHWVDNDGTFSSAGSIALPKNKAVTLNVNINPTSAAHTQPSSTWMIRASAGIEYQTMNVVIAADQFTGPDYSVTKTGSLGPGQFETFSSMSRPEHPPSRWI